MRCAAEGNRLMSMPISETMTCALRFLTLGIDMINSTAVRRGQGLPPRHHPHYREGWSVGRFQSDPR
jgi:hypothetical protein